MKRAQAESELEALFARLTTEERMFLRDEITREIEEQFVIGQSRASEKRRRS